MTYTCDSAANDEDGGGWGHGAEETANLEDEDGRKIGKLNIEQLVDGTIHWL